MNVSTANRRASKFSAIANLAQDLWLPTLPLPKNTWRGDFIESRLVDDKNNTIALTPAVDPITSEYGEIYLPNRCTLRFIEFVNQKFVLYQLSDPRARLEYAVGIHRTLNNFLLIEVDPNDAQVRRTLAFYLDNQIFINNNGNIGKLKNYGEALAPKYVKKLEGVEYLLKNQRKKLTGGEAQAFVKNCQKKIEEHIAVLFQTLNPKTSSETPKPEDTVLPAGLKTVTPEILLKINPSFSQPRAAELAPYINQAIASAQIKSLIAEAMFLAQVVHEIGLNPNLEEDGKNSTKTYGGKKYPYFFYMYDKDSPDPEGRRAAKRIGNTESGDGDKFHGRGFLQLTGRWNYNAAGNYIKLDLISRPELVSNIATAALTAGWFWHQYRKINDLIKTGSEAEFGAVTEKINSAKKGYANRAAFWGKAKLALGIK